MRYTRMHGAGNSFVILENLHGELSGEDLGALALRICDPDSGPGADGMIVVTPSEGDEDFGMLFYNADGSKGEMCGNGARCVARYGVEHGLSRDPGHIRFHAPAGEITARRIDEENYEVRLNDPSVIDLCRVAGSDAGTVLCSYVELGDPGIPHAVVRVFDDAFSDLDALREKGRALRRSPAFPRGANVTFASVDENDRVRAITFERGVEDLRSPAARAAPPRRSVSACSATWRASASRSICPAARCPSPCGARAIPCATSSSPARRPLWEREKPPCAERNRFHAKDTGNTYRISGVFFLSVRGKAPPFTPPGTELKRPYAYATIESK